MREEPSGARVLWRLLGLVRPLAGFMLVAVLCGVAGFLCATAIPGLAAHEAWALASGADAALPLGAACAALAALAVARGVLHYLEQTCNHYIAFKLLAHVRDLVFGALRRLAPAKLAGKDKGALISSVTADVELLELFFAHTISPVLIAAIMCAALACFVGGMHPALALCALAGYAAVGVVVPLVSSRRTASAGDAAREQAASLSGFVLDGLRGLGEVLQFGAGERRLAELDGRSRGLTDAQGDIAGIAAHASAATSVLICLTSLAETFVGVGLVRAGALDPAAALLAAVLVSSSFGPFVAVSNLGASLASTIAAGRRILAILDEEPAVREAEDPVEIDFAGAEARDVGFSYVTRDEDGAEHEEMVLDGVDISVDKGEIVGICGPSGSGKSTLLRLFMRYWDVGRGEIEVSGEPIGRIATTSLRDAESLVEQETHLFHDSIRDNLLVAKPDATQEEVEEACRAASIYDFVSALPHGLDTEVGELGSTLSGGERQRLGLARAFLHGAPFLLLDEPTSNVDALNEGTILRSIARERAGRSILLVSHRASTLAIADRTYEMDRGSVS